MACSSVGLQEVAEPTTTAAAESIVFLPPGAGAVLSIVETRYTNAEEQLISLTTRAKAPSQNFIRVQRFTGVAHSARPGALQDVPLGNLDMAGEARGTVNFADMKASPFFVQNSYGPFGYSMGRTATADLCMYAWQRIAERKKPGGGVERGSINIRMQYCDQDATEAELLNIMLQLRIRGVAGTVVGSPVAIGTVGATITPADSIFPGNVLPVPARPSSAPRPSPAPAPVREVEAPIGVPVPAPSTGGTGTSPSIPSPGTTTSPSSPTVPAPNVPAPGTTTPTVPAPNVRLLPVVPPASPTLGV